MKYKLICVCIIASLVVKYIVHILSDLVEPDAWQDTLGAAPATEVKLEDHCPYKYAGIWLFAAVHLCTFTVLVNIKSVAFLTVC